MDGNMLSNGYIECEFDSANRLISAGGHTYTYNAEDVRIRNLCADADTTYTYNTNCRLSQLLCKTTNGITTKYVYGLGLIGEEKCSEFKTYHFDYRGSTVAITDIYGNITDTFKYDTYGKLISRTGNSFVILGYNGRDGVVTDRNGLLYMRARYYSPDMRRFINADILHGEISDSTSLNRYAYANGNPISFVDPFGLSSKWGNWLKVGIGVAIITTLVVVATVATAGSALAVVAGAAAVGGAVGGTVGAVSGYIENGVDGAVNGFLVGTVSGAASGAIGGTGAPAALVATANAGINVGEIYLDDVIEDGKINKVTDADILYAIITGYAFDWDDGLLAKGSKLEAAQNLYRKKVSKELRRSNTEYAAKNIKKLTAQYDSIYQEVLGEYAYNTLLGKIDSEIRDQLKESFSRGK